MTKLDAFRLFLLTGAVAALCFARPASPHDVWADGEPVPVWVKKACCGPDDVHHPRPDQVHLTASGWRVDGYPDLIPTGDALPSPDGEYWIFYRSFPNGQFSHVYCFFAPFQGI